MLLLLYVTLTVYFVLVFMLPTVYQTVIGFVKEEINMTLYPSMLYIGVFLMLSMLGFLITIFIRFHIGLIVKNSTTIENMEEQQLKQKATTEVKTVPKNYDVGYL